MSDAALRFAKRIIQASQEYGGDVDGADIQEWAVEAGLLVPTEMQQACSEGCVCAELDEFPQMCYRYSPELEAVDVPPR